MSRRALAVCASALALLVAAPALAQNGAAAPALPVSLIEIPAVSDKLLVQPITLWVDATDIERRIMSVRQSIP
ncbi:MAG: peptidase M61, partial [Brevundimonas sp.]